MATEVKAPNHYETMDNVSIFLAGSIEQGAAEPWQLRLFDALKDEENVVVLNPRREEWDSSWEQSITNGQFRGQVEWEIEAQENADIIAMYFDPKTKSPITLLELGLFARTGKLIVCCPEGYWRKGNVDVTCNFYGVQQARDFDQLVGMVKSDIALVRADQR